MRTLRKYLLVAVITSGTAGAAVTDYTLGAGFRTTPWGAGINAVIGRGLLMWGDPSPGNYRYGYLRPYARAQVSGFTNRFEAGFEIFPVAPVTLTIAQAYTHRNLKKIATLPCEGLECRGWLSRTIFSDRWMLGYGPFFYVGTYRMELLTPEVRSKNFGDEASNLAGASGSDTLLGLSTILGSRITENYRVGAIVDAARMRKTGSNNFLGLLFVRRDWTPYNLTVASGWYRSNFKGPGWTLLMGFEWQGGESLALH